MAEQRLFEDAKIMFRNFKGEARPPFTEQGDRKFNLFLDPETAEEMRKEGWNVKQMKVREEGEIPQDHIEVTVNYGGKQPPRCVLVTSRGRTELTEDTVFVLDSVQLKKVDLILNPYHWDVNGNKGIKAYLKTIFVTAEEDYLEQKYAEDQGNETTDDDGTAPWDQEDAA